MKTDRELLELAAKAAGIEVQDPETGAYSLWNPLTDDGDALRLAVKLEIPLCFPFLLPQLIKSVRACVDCFESQGDDPYAATRRAITRAAAEIGSQS